MEYIQHAIEQLNAFGLHADTLDTSGKLVRVPVEGDKGRKKSGWYVAHEFPLRNGRTVITGRFGNWKLTDETQAFEADFSFSDDDRKALKAKQDADRKQLEAERRRAAADAAKRAGKMWEAAHETGNHPYLEAKAVRGYWVRYLRELLLVPVRDIDGALVGLQTIQADGTKKFITGTPKQGAFHCTAPLEAAAEADTVLVTEGYATAASLTEATGLPCLVAFDAGNLLPVAQAWRKQHAQQLLVIAGDDDMLQDCRACGALTTVETPECDHCGEPHRQQNTGRLKAARAAQAVGGVRVLPEFSGERPRDAKGPTDFNDLCVLEGQAVVRAQVLAAIEQGAPEDAAGDDLPPLEAYGADSARETEPPTAASGDETIDPARDFALPRLLHDFVILHGSGGGLFDDRRCEFMSVADFRTSVGNKAANEYLNHPERRVVFRRNVVFDPTRLRLPQTHINLFRGLPLQPKKGSCDKLLDLLFHLCECNEEVYDWVLKWIAYPLQHVGAKMTTAVVIHGREGAGKNLFWSALQRIYGEYTSIITQNDLESNFNGWASRKLFVIGNEVVSRQEMFHKKGIMKNMITEPEWNINEKNINQRKEANHANFVFFSNFLQPVTPDKDDRRYLVLWTPQKKDKGYYQAVARERDNGGSEALYEYLLHYDTGEFDEYTEPVMTAAKQDLIDLSMKSDERFLEMWLYGDLPLPVGAVLTSDLYRAYKHWCHREGEKFYVSATEFGTQINKHEQIEKKPDQRYMRGAMDAKGTFAIPEWCKRPDDMPLRKWLTDCADDFLDQYKIWMDGREQ